MKVQTLIVTVNQTDISFAEKMNIQTDAVIANQCGKNEVLESSCNGNAVKLVSTDTKGVGINRNEALIRSVADICVLADDDMVFKTGYAETVTDWFESIREADMLIFNLDCEKKRYINKKIKRINRFNYAKYGAARLAFKREPVLLSGVTFNTLFGGGCKYSCGEDTIFLRECIRKGLRIYAVPDTIASISDDASSWFEGYNDKYFFDKGVLFWVLNRRFCKVNAALHAIKHRKRYEKYGIKNAFLKMLEGIGSVKR